ncbi:aldehyde dehydrogenase family protein [Rhodococcus koreensis]
MEHSPRMTINGRAVGSPESFEVVNPATEAVWTTAPDCTREQLDEAFAAAAAAQPVWAADIERRRAALATMADVMVKSSDELAAILTQEQGKTLADSKAEIEGVGVWFKYYADLAFPSEEVIQDNEFGRVTTVRHPLGVVAAITPWNFPLALAAWKIGPALLAGNTMVLKPSPYTPISTLRMGELFAAVLPAGVFNVVSGGDELGEWMTAHQVPSKVSFTGSVSAGKAVARSAADDLKRVTLELGGNDPAILLDDVDPKAIAKQIFWGAFYNNGQVCGCIKRVYVPESLYETVARELAEIADAVKVGDGTEPDTILGPVSNRPQFNRVNELLAEAISDGATLRSGGKPVGDRGFFITPAVLTDVSPESRIVQEEQFGPVLPLVSYRNLDEAIAEINKSKYALGSSVWGTDPARLREVARSIDAGLTWINTHASLTPNVPFGGAKWSGIGVEGGLGGVHEYTQLQVVHEPQG